VLEIDGLVGLAFLGFWIWALLDVIATDASLCRNLSKAVWLLLVILLADIGALLWLLAGRPHKGAWRLQTTDYAAPRRPLGVEDEPGFHENTTAITDRRSQELDEQLAQWEREQERKRDEEDH
jgi:hypothetical protein